MGDETERKAAEASNSRNCFGALSVKEASFLRL